MSCNDLIDRLQQVIAELIHETQLYNKALSEEVNWDVNAKILDRLEELRSELRSLRMQLHRGSEGTD